MPNNPRLKLTVANTDSKDRVYRNASVQGSRLLKGAGVRARVRSLQEDAVEEAMLRLRPWMELAIDAQETLRKALTGDLRFPEAGPRLEPEMIFGRLSDRHGRSSIGLSGR